MFHCNDSPHFIKRYYVQKWSCKALTANPGYNALKGLVILKKNNSRSKLHRAALSVIKLPLSVISLNNVYHHNIPIFLCRCAVTLSTSNLFNQVAACCTESIESKHLLLEQPPPPPCHRAFVSPLSGERRGWRELYTGRPADSRNLKEIFSFAFCDSMNKQK